MLSHCEILLAQCEIRLRRVRNRWQNPTFRQPVLGGGTKTVAGAILPSAYKTKSMLPPNYGMGHKHPTRANLCFALKVLKGVGNFFKSFPRKTASPAKTRAPRASCVPKTRAPTNMVCQAVANLICRKRGACAKYNFLSKVFHKKRRVFSKKRKVSPRKPASP